MALPFLAQAGLAAGAGALAGFIGGGAEKRRRDRLMRELTALLSPGRLGEEATSFFNVFRQSPMYTGLRRGALTGATSLANRLQASFAQRGLGRSGIAALSLPIAQASFAPGLMDIDAQLYAQALGQARQSLQERAAILRGGVGPGAGESAVAGGLEALLPMLLEYFKRRG